MTPHLAPYAELGRHTVDLIKDYIKATIILPKGTKLQIEDALYSNKYSINLLSFKDIRRNGYHIETMNHDEN